MSFNNTATTIPYTRQSLLASIAEHEKIECSLLTSLPKDWFSTPDANFVEKLTEQELSELDDVSLWAYKQSHTGRFQALQAAANKELRRRASLDDLTDLSDSLAKLCGHIITGADGPALTPATHDELNALFSAYVRVMSSHLVQYSLDSAPDPELEGLLKVNEIEAAVRKAVGTEEYCTMVCLELIRDAWDLGSADEIGEHPLSGLPKSICEQIERAAKDRVLIKRQHWGEGAWPSATPRYRTFQVKETELSLVPLALLNRASWDSQAGILNPADFTAAELEIIFTLYGEDAYTTLDAAAQAARAIEEQE